MRLGLFLVRLLWAKNVLFSGTLFDGFYKLNVFSCDGNKLVDSKYITCLSVNSSLLWHLRLRHVNVQKMRRMVRIGLLPNLHNEFHVCENCLSDKMTRAPFGKGKRT